MSPLDVIALVMAAAAVAALFRKDAALSLACSSVSLYCSRLARKWREQRGD
jgi:hypothetical protein